MPVWELLVVAVLILLNGFFAMSEIALVSARRVRLQQRADAGDSGAAAAVALSAEPTRFLSTVQIGITLIGVLAGAYSGARLAEPLAAFLAGLPLIDASAPALALGIVVVSIASASLIVGELVPKRLALANAEGIAARVARPMIVIGRVAAPVVWFLQITTEAILRLLRVRTDNAQTVTEEEVKALIAEGTQSGVFHEAERDMIDGVLRLADRPVRSVMTPRRDVIWLDPEDDQSDWLRVIGESGHSRFPVGRRGVDELLGIVHTKDLLQRSLSGAPLDLAASAREPIAVHEDASVLRLLDLFRLTGIHLAVVLDEHGDIKGITTPTDILTAIAGDLPEAEQDGWAEVAEREDGSWLIDGRMDAHRIRRLLEVEDMGEGDFSTLAGFVLRQLGHLPVAGEKFEWRGFRFEVVDMDGRRIDKLLVTRLPPDGDPEEADADPDSRDPGP